MEKKVAFDYAIKILEYQISRLEEYSLVRDNKG